MNTNYYYDKVDNLVFDFENQLSTLSSYRLAKINSCKNDEDKRRCLGATILLDKALAEYGLKEQDMLYGLNEHLKPYFTNREDIKFSLSHSGEYVAVAVSHKEIGIDIQQTGEVNLKIAERFFTRYECEYIKNRDDFYRIWVLKESFIKAIGKGLAMPLNSFCIEDLDRKPRVKFENKIFTFTEKSAEDYKIAVCTEE